MRRTFFMLLIVVATLTATSSAFAQNQNPMVGGAAMFRTKDIVDNAVNSADHTTLVAAVKAAGLVDTRPGNVGLFHDGIYQLEHVRRVPNNQPAALRQKICTRTRHRKRDALALEKFLRAFPIHQ